MTTEATTAQDGATTDQQNGASAAPDTKGVKPTAAAAKPEAGKSEETVPLGTFKDLERQLKAERGAAKELAELKQKQEDEAAQKAGDLDKFKTERDQALARVKELESTATAWLDGLVKGMSDDQKGLFESLVDDDTPLSKRLAAAQKIASQTTNSQPASFGSTGQPAKEPESALPGHVQSAEDYREWMANLPMQAEGRAKLKNLDWMAKVRAEARDKGFIRTR